MAVGLTANNVSILDDSHKAAVFKLYGTHIGGLWHRGQVIRSSECKKGAASWHSICFQTAHGTDEDADELSITEPKRYPTLPSTKAGQTSRQFFCRSRILSRSSPESRPPSHGFLPSRQPPTRAPRS